MMDSYKLTTTNSVIRLSDNAVIPFSNENGDYLAYLRWRDGWVETPVTGYDTSGVPIYGAPISHAPNSPLPAQELAEAQSAQINSLYQSYITAIAQPVGYMATVFQADQSSILNLQNTLAALMPQGSTPTGFYWVDATNNHVLMSLAQIQGLAATIFAQGWASFQNLQNKKALVLAATTVAAVQLIVF